MRLSALSPAALLVVACAISPAALAQTHGYAPLAYSGSLEHGGIPLDEARSLRFGLFLSQAASATCLVSATGDCPYWSEEHAGVPVKGGRFSVALGSQREISSALLSEPELYLGVAVEDPVDGWILLGGLQRLLAVPRAARTEQVIPPVGSVIAWHPNLFPGAPPALPAGWVRCDGQTINDVKSPLNGRTVPNLNGEARFLRGGNTSGMTQADQLRTHTHFDSGHNHSFLRPRWFGNETPNGVYMYNPESATADAQSWTTNAGYADLGEPAELNGTPLAHGGETRPTNMSVVWIMRVR